MPSAGEATKREKWGPKSSIVLATTGVEFDGMKVTESFPTRVVGARFFPATRSREIARVSSLKSTESTSGGGWQYSNFVLT